LSLFNIKPRIIFKISFLFRFTYSKGLINYWPIRFDVVSNEYSGKSNIYSGKSLLTNDRFGKVHSALCPNGFNLTLESGVHFPNESFTFSLWIKFKKFDSNAKIFDCFNLRNENSNDHIDSIQIWQSNEGLPLIKIQQLNGESRITQANTGFQLNTWHFFTVSLNQTHLKMYLNETIISEDNEQFILLNGWRKYAYIGLNSDSIFDDIRIYNRALEIGEIVILMNTSDEMAHQNKTLTLKKRSVHFSQDSNSFRVLIDLILAAFFSILNRFFNFLSSIFL
jgi:hypothetical protein